MLPFAFDPFVDAILRDHVLRAAQDLGVTLDELERVAVTPTAAVQFLRACGRTYYEDYLEDASAAVDHVGWIVVDAATGCELPA